MNKKKLGLWVLRLVPSLIMLQTLFFKFSAHPEAVVTFSALVGLEPTGRILVGVVELIIGLALFTPGYRIASIFSLGIGVGAIISHVLVLGYNSLFVMALVVFFCSLAIIIIERKEIKRIIKSIF